MNQLLLCDLGIALDDQARVLLEILLLETISDGPVETFVITNVL